MGYVYYGNYASYYEIGRVESLRALGLSYKTMEEDGYIMPVLENKSSFKAPALYDELLTIHTIIKEMPRVRITFHYEIYNESDKLIHIGETTLVFVDKKTNRPCPPPENMTKLLASFFPK